VVITGRCVDSALVLGPLIHEFGWRETDFDQLSAGSLAGHIVECGAQATGGIATDWRDVEAGWEDIAFPIVECAADGTFVVTKAAGHSGRVTPLTIAEQITYEVGDPRAYLLPDVQCDWSDIRLEAVGEDRVRVSSARGVAPPSSYKVSATYPDGWRASATMMLVGRDAAARARRVGEAILARSGRLITAAGLTPFFETSVEILGAETTFGAQSRAGATREVVLKIAARHATRDALEIFAREIFPAATAMAQSLTGFAGGRPNPQPVVRLFSFLIDKSDVPIRVQGPDGKEIPVAIRQFDTSAPPIRATGETPAELSMPLVAVPLISLAVGRSGDKGDSANIGVIARRPDFLPPIRAALTADAVAAYFAHYVRGRVERFAWPGLNAFNFVLHEALGGGGMASLRHDPQGKALAQALMDFLVPVPASWLEPGAILEAYAGEVTTQ